MLTKILGSILVLVSCTGIGFSKSLELKGQLEELETLKHIFSLLKAEMSYTHGIFEEIFANIGNKISGKYGTWLLQLAEILRRKLQIPFEKIWTDSIENYLKDSKLTSSDQEELRKIGYHLGNLESIELYIEQLEYEIQIRREEYRPKRKLCQSMGIMGGVFLVILLL